MIQADAIDDPPPKPAENTAAQQRPADKIKTPVPTLQPGAVVTLNSGGPKMTVEEVNEHDPSKVNLVHLGDTGIIERVCLPIACLSTRIEPKTGPLGFIPVKGRQTDADPEQVIREFMGQGGQTDSDRGPAVHFGSVVGGAACDPAISPSALYSREWSGVTCRECISKWFREGNAPIGVRYVILR